MIQLKDLLILSRILVNINVTSKKRALEIIAKTFVVGCDDVDEQQVFELLLERERLGTTGFGGGVAIPHCRVKGFKEPIVVIVKLPVPIDFDAVDEQPVDLLIGLAVPDDAVDDHLQLLRQIAGILENKEVCTALRKAEKCEDFYEIMVDGLTSR